MNSRSPSGVRANVYPNELRETGLPRALVADDDAGIRVLIDRILTRNGFHVDAVRDGAEAIEHILQRDYDVIVLDLMMPRIDGLAVAEYLQRNRPELLTRVIVVTAFGPCGLEKVRALVDDCIEKPFEVGGLVQKARAILERARRSENPRTEAADSDDAIATPSS